MLGEEEGRGPDALHGSRHEAVPHRQRHIVWDNLNIHHGEVWEAFSRRHGGRFRFVYTPIHASWVNQVEVWFSLLARRVLKHATFATADDLVQAVDAFVANARSSASTRSSPRSRSPVGKM